MGIEDDIAFIERVPTLRMLGRTALRILAIGAESRYVHQGDVLFHAGDATDCGYVIVVDRSACRASRARWARLSPAPARCSESLR